MKLASVRTRVWVGGFILGLMVLAGSFVMLSSQGAGLWSKTHRYQVVFTDATGLQMGAPVRMGGLSIGHIIALDLAYEHGDGVVNATLEIEDAHRHLIREGTMASLQTQGVLGDKFISLSAGDPAKPLVPDEGRIPARTPLVLDQVMRRSADVVENLAVLSEKLAAFAAGLPPPNEMHQLTASVIASGKSFEMLSKKLASDEGALAYLTSREAKEKVQVSLEQLVSTTTQVQTIIDKVNSTEGTLGLLINDPVLHDDLRALLGRTNRSRMARGLVREALKQGETAIGH